MKTIQLLLLLWIPGQLVPEVLGQIAPSDAQIFVTSTTGDVYRSSIDGSNVEVIDDRFNLPWPVAVDPLTRSIFVSDFLSGSIVKMNYNGGFKTTVVFGQGYVIAIAIDPIARKLYWTNSLDGRVSRANMDGSDIEHIVTGLESPEGVALDLVDGKVYWSEFLKQGAVSRANLDGTDVELIIAGGVGGNPKAEGIAIDEVGRKLYIADLSSGRIQRTTLDGTDIEVLVDSLGQPQQLALDQVSRKVYWADTVLEKVMRSNFDGSDVEDVLVMGLPVSVALDFSATSGFVVPGDTTADYLSSGVLIEFTASPVIGGQISINLFSSSTTNVQELETLEVQSPSGPITPDIVSDKRQWRIAADSLANFEYNICLSIEDLERVVDFDQLVIVTRSTSESMWTPVNTTRETRGGTDVLCAGGLTDFGDFGFGSVRAVNALPVEPSDQISTSPRIESIYPNPVKKSGTVQYSAPAGTAIYAAIVDMMGREVSTLLDGQTVGPGTQQLTLDVSNIPAGVYLLSLGSEYGQVSRALVVVR